MSRSPVRRQPAAYCVSAPAVKKLSCAGETHAALLAEACGMATAPRVHMVGVLCGVPSPEVITVDEIEHVTCASCRDRHRSSLMRPLDGARGRRRGAAADLCASRLPLWAELLVVGFVVVFMVWSGLHIGVIGIGDRLMLPAQAILWALRNPAAMLLLLTCIAVLVARVGMEGLKLKRRRDRLRERILG